MVLRSPALATVFKQAGWFPGRNMQLTDAAPSGHPAFAILSAFAGLSVEDSGRGETAAASDVHFTEMMDDLEEALELERLLDDRLLAIAEIHRAHAQLYIAQSGRCFGVSIIHRAIWLVGETFEEAIIALLSGKRPQPILLPGQSSVTLHGDIYRDGHSDLYEPALHAR